MLNSLPETGIHQEQGPLAIQRQQTFAHQVHTLHTYLIFTL